MKKIKSAVVVYYTKYYKTLLSVRKALMKAGISAVFIKRENEGAIRKSVKNADALIVVGGDGTLLQASHFLEKTPALHISSGRTEHEAFFARAYEADAAGKLKRLAQGRYKIVHLDRLEAALNGRRIPFNALNEVFIGGHAAYHTVRYNIQIGGNSEEQKSSGVIIATPAGSHAWAKSAGGKTIPITAKGMVYVVREPYFGRLLKPKLLKGVLGRNSTVKVTSKIWHRHQGIVVVDSYNKTFPFNSGDRLTVKMARQPFNLITF
ncbi:NAD(+)/NADH kinase [Candidatus Woesearchaeota archaeon]|nr:NAD(+)/NADH kinase [Candidatus Woesearchaeota archaeon]